MDRDRDRNRNNYREKNASYVINVKNNNNRHQNRKRNNRKQFKKRILKIVFSWTSILIILFFLIILLLLIYWKFPFQEIMFKHEHHHGRYGDHNYHYKENQNYDNDDNQQQQQQQQNSAYKHFSDKIEFENRKRKRIKLRKEGEEEGNQYSDLLYQFEEYFNLTTDQTTYVFYHPSGKKGQLVGIDQEYLQNYGLCCSFYDIKNKHSNIFLTKQCGNTRKLQCVIKNKQLIIYVDLSFLNIQQFIQIVSVCVFKWISEET